MAAWYCLIGDQEYGPFGSERIQGLVKKGKLTKDHFVRTSTDTQWISASEIPGLFPTEKPKAAAPKAAPPRVKPPESPPTARSAPPVAAETNKPPIPAALPVTAEKPEIPSALPVAAPVAAPIATPVATPTSLPVGTPVAAPSPAVPAKDQTETIARIRKKSKQQQYLVVGGLAVVLVVLGAIVVIALNRSPGTQSEKDRVAQSTTDDTETSAPAADVEADPNPEMDPVVDEPAHKQADGEKPVILPAIKRWLDASTQKGILRISDSMIRFHVVNVWLDSDESGSQTLTVEVTLTNGSTSESLDFRGWTLAAGDTIDDAVVLADDKDRRLSPSSTSGQAVKPRSAARRLKPKESAKDQLVFESPTGEYKQLRLYLPYAAIGRTGHIGFEIPRVMIKDSPPGSEEPVATVPGPAVAKPVTIAPVPKPEIVTKPPKPDDPFSMDVLRDSIKESMADGEEPNSESDPTAPGTPEQPKPIDGSGPTLEGDNQMMEERSEVE